MAARVVLVRRCRPELPRPSVVLAAVDAAGLKAVTLLRRPADEDEVRLPLARAVGLPRSAVLAGCPVPFAAGLAVWRGVQEELDAGRWDAVVVPAGHCAAAVELVAVPERLLDVLDARLDEIGPDGGSAGLLDDLLRLRRETAGLLPIVRSAMVVAGCAEPEASLLALPLVQASDPLGATTATCGTEREGDGYVWWLRVGGPVEVHRAGEGTLEVTLGDARRAFRLPAALRRCAVQGAAVRHGVLRVRFAPDAERWRWT